MSLPADRVASLCQDGVIVHEGIGYFTKRCQVSLIGEDQDPESLAFPFNHFQFEVSFVGGVLGDGGDWSFAGCLVNTARINDPGGHHAGLHLNHWDIAQACPMYVYQVFKEAVHDGLHWHHDGALAGLRFGILEEDGGASGLPGDVVVSPRHGAGH